MYPKSMAVWLEEAGLETDSSAHCRKGTSGTFSAMMARCIGVPMTRLPMPPHTSPVGPAAELASLTICSQRHPTGCLIHNQVVRLPFAGEEVQLAGLQAHTVPTESSRARARAAGPLLQHNFCSQAALDLCVCRKERALLFIKLPYNSWAWERAGFLSNYLIFPGSPWVSYPYPLWSPPRCISSPLWSIFALTAHALSGTSPSALLPPPLAWEKGLFPLSDGSWSSLIPRHWPLGQADWAIPWSVCEMVVSQFHQAQFPPFSFLTSHLD